MQTACQRSVYKYADKIPTYLDLFPPKLSESVIESTNVGPITPIHTVHCVLPSTLLLVLLIIPDQLVSQDGGYIVPNK